MEALAEVRLDEDPIGEWLVVLYELDNPVKYAPTTMSSRTMTIPAENMT